MKKTEQRHVWAARTLALAPDDRVLEIGCGHGHLTELICEGLNGGHYVGVDQSERMIASAAKRNEAAIRAGKARLITAPLHELAEGELHFNKICAANVNLFWTGQAARELALLRGLLLPEGKLYLFNQPPAASKLDAITDSTIRNLTAAGFAICGVETSGPADGLEAPVVCVVATLA